MLAMPDKRPAGLEYVEHLQVRVVAAQHGADRELDSMDNDRKRTACALRAVDVLSHEIHHNRRSLSPLTAERFRRDFDEVHHVPPVQLRWQPREIRQPDADGLD